jgi:hypothetical protein
MEGWHVSQESPREHSWKVENGVLSDAGQEGQRRIVLTDKSTGTSRLPGDEPDFGCDGSIPAIHRRAPGNVGYLAGGMGGIWRGLKDVRGAVEGWRELEEGEWNTIRARIEGAVPRIRSG